MTKERPEGPELILTTLDKLGKAPVTVEEIKTILPLMRVEAEGAGIKLELSKEGRESLGERQFRDLESGRGPGIVEALEQKKARGLLDWCQKNGKRKIGGKERTEGRGLQQAAADMISLLATESPTDEEIVRFVTKLNQRAKKGLGRKAGEVWDQVPKIEPKKEWQQMASVPQGKVKELWEFMVGT